MITLSSSLLKCSTRPFATDKKSAAVPINDSPPPPQGNSSKERGGGEGEIIVGGNRSTKKKLVNEAGRLTSKTKQVPGMFASAYYNNLIRRLNGDNGNDEGLHAFNT